MPYDLYVSISQVGFLGLGSTVGAFIAHPCVDRSHTGTVAYRYKHSVSLSLNFFGGPENP